MNKNELLKELAVNALFVIILYLFYKSWWAFLFLPPCTVFYHFYYRKERLERRKEVLDLQFKDALLSMTAALRAGYSVENALRESFREMTSMYGADSAIAKELNTMLHQLALGLPAEQVFDELAVRNDIEDISTFASVFRIARQSAGNLIEILKESADEIASRVDTRSEIAVLVSQKRFEQNIMSLMPVIIILYVDLTGDGLLDPLYGNPAGILIMTACLALYAAACFLSRKIMQIRV